MAIKQRTDTGYLINVIDKTGETFSGNQKNKNREIIFLCDNSDENVIFMTCNNEVLNKKIR